jgi:hypothetical protein
MKTGRPVDFARRVPLALALVMFAAAPAMAGSDVDKQCASSGNIALNEGKQCRSAAGGSAVRNCLLSHANDFNLVASVCINAAESHYEAAAGLKGHDADSERLKAGAALSLAATANLNLFNYDLASAQARSAISLFSRVRDDPGASDLAPLAAQGLKAAGLVLHAALALR